MCLQTLQAYFGVFQGVLVTDTHSPCFSRWDELLGTALQPIGDGYGEFAEVQTSPEEAAAEAAAAAVVLPKPANPDILIQLKAGEALCETRCDAKNCFTQGLSFYQCFRHVE